MTNKKYIITRDCSEGNAGDIVSIDWNGADGADWENETQGVGGNPFCSIDSIKELNEGGMNK